MNPAALRANVPDLLRGAIVIVNTDEFTTRNLAKAGYQSNPLEDGSLEGYQVQAVPLHLDDSARAGQLRHLEEGRRAVEEHVRARPALLDVHRPTEGTIKFLETKFASKPEIAGANIAAFRAGVNYGETPIVRVSYEVKPAVLPAGTYRNISGNLALAYGLIAAANRPGWRSSSARTRSPPRRTSCMSCPGTSGSACGRSRPRTRSPASAPRSEPPSVVPSGDDHVRPGAGAEGRDGRAGCLDGTAAGDL